MHARSAGDSLCCGNGADLLVIDGDPLRDISLLAADGKNLRMIVRGGEIVKDELR